MIPNLGLWLYGKIYFVNLLRELPYSTIKLLSSMFYLLKIRKIIQTAICPTISRPAKLLLIMFQLMLKANLKWRCI